MCVRKKNHVAVEIHPQREVDLVQLYRDLSCTGKWDKNGFEVSTSKIKALLV